MNKAPPEPISPSRRVEALDVVRGIAILLVLLRHAWPGAFPGAGVAGVVVFFALSGYLITGVLLGELRTTGRVNLGRFYARRARRLVPALLAMMIGFAVVTLTIDPLGDRSELVRSVIVGVTYTADLPFHRGSLALFHLWTLAAEEQFYLLWPALLAWAWSRRLVWTTLAVGAATSIAACVASLVWLSPHPDLAYPLPTSWSICLLLGAAARLLSDRVPPSRGDTSPTRPAVVASGIAIATLAVASMVPLRGHALTYLVGGPVIAALACVLLVAWRSWLVVPQPLRPLVALGTVSYGVYLWDYPVTLWLRPSMGAWAGLAGAALAVLAATVSWRLIEKPMMRRGRSQARTPTPAGIGA